MQKKAISLAAIVLIFGLVGCSGSKSAPSSKSRDGWTPLLKVDTLDGWYTYLQDKGVNQDPDGIFTIRDGVLHIYKNAQDGSKMPFGYIATPTEYANYRLRLEYKWGEKKFAPRADQPRDSGLLYHFVGADKVWPLSVECQIMEGDTGTIYIVGTTVTSTVDPATKAYKDAAQGGVELTQSGSPKIKKVLRSQNVETPGWNTVEVIIRNDGAVHIINGTVVNQCTRICQPDPKNSDTLIPLTKGKILLQAEGAEVFYRNVEIKPLD
jgi:hypothetical protein